MAFDYFYDAQIRRYVLQFMRIFHEIKIASVDENGSTLLERLPIRWGGMDRSAGHVLRENSENVVLPGNMMAAYIQSIQLDGTQRKSISGERKLQVDEREFDEATQSYTNNIGKRYTIESLMPTAMKMEMSLDILTDKMDTKLQVLEQIFMIFNPGITIQQNDNALDFSSFFNVELKNIQWSNRGAGDDVDRDVASLTFELSPIWINPPSKVKRRKVIHQIVTNAYAMAEIDHEELKKYALSPIENCFDRFDQIIVSPNNHQFKIGMDGVTTSEVMLLNEYGQEDESLSWESLIDLYGEYSASQSYIIIKTLDDIEDESGDIYANFSFDPVRSNIINIDIDEDTLPSVISGGPVDRVINPLKTYPNNGLPNAAAGQRYLVLEDIPLNTGTNPWGSVNASEGDIIQYDGANWNIVFSAASANNAVYVRALNNNELYKYDPVRLEWVNALRFQLHPGYLRIILTRCD